MWQFLSISFELSVGEILLDLGIVYTDRFLQTKIPEQEMPLKKKIG